MTFHLLQNSHMTTEIKYQKQFHWETSKFSWYWFMFNIDNKKLFPYLNHNTFYRAEAFVGSK